MSHDPLFNLPTKIMIGVFPRRQSFYMELLDIPENVSGFGSYPQAVEWIRQNRKEKELPLGTSPIEFYEK